MKIEEKIENIECFKIVKDPEECDLFYAIIQDDYDSDGVWSIIACGSTETETMENFIKQLYKKYRTCFKKIQEIGNSISDRNLFDISSDLYLNSHYIEKEADFGDHISTSFDAMVYDEEANIWCRMYR